MRSPACSRQFIRCIIKKGLKGALCEAGTVLWGGAFARRDLFGSIYRVVLPARLDPENLLKAWLCVSMLFKNVVGNDLKGSGGHFDIFMARRPVDF